MKAIILVCVCFIMGLLVLPVAHSEVSATPAEVGPILPAAAQPAAPSAPANVQSGEKSPASGRVTSALPAETLSATVKNLSERLGSKDFRTLIAAIQEAHKLVFSCPAGTDMSPFVPLVAPLFDHANWGGEGGATSGGYWPMAADVLVRIGQPAIPLLKKKLKSEDSRDPGHDRWSAMDILSRIGEPKDLVLSSARDMLKDNDRQLRRTAIEALGRMGKDAEAAVADLKADAADNYGPNQILVQLALIRIEGVSEERIKSIARHLTAGDADAEASYAAAVLGDLGEAAKAAGPELVEALKSPAAQVRVNTAEALGKVGYVTDTVIAALTDRLENDTEPYVRDSSASALESIGRDSKVALAAVHQYRAEQASRRGEPPSAVVKPDVSPTPANIPSGEKAGPVKLTPEQVKERDKAFAEVVEKFHQGLRELAKVYPQLATSRGQPLEVWFGHELEQPGELHFGVGRSNATRGKRTPEEKIPDSLTWELGVLLVPTEQARGNQALLGPAYPHLNLSGMTTAKAGDVQLDAALKKLLAEALKPLVTLDEKVKETIYQ